MTVIRSPISPVIFSPLRAPTALYKGGGGASIADIERIGVIGHSFVRSMVSTWGASVTNMRFTSLAWAHYAAMLSNRTFWVDPLACEGYSGSRTNQIESSILPLGSTTSFGPSGQKINIPYGIRSTGVKRVFVCALVNDMSYEGVQQSTTTPDPTPAITRLRSLWATLRSYGIEPINISISPRNDSYSGAVSDWFDAEAAAAALDGVQNIDILTPCSDDAATWKTGYDWTNGVEDATTMHPGADGCWAIAAAIASAVTSTKTSTPYLSSATEAALVRGDQTKFLGVISTGWDGLFASAANWPARISVGGTSTRTVASGGIAEVGQYLEVDCAPQAGNFQADFVTPTLTGLTIGERYGVLFRIKFDAGAAKPTTGDNPDTASVTIEDTSFNVITGFSSGGVNAYSVAGASIPESDVYLEFVATATSHRVRFDQVTRPASTGSVLQLAQAGAIAA